MILNNVRNFVLQNVSYFVVHKVSAKEIKILIIYCYHFWFIASPIFANNANRYMSINKHDIFTYKVTFPESQP